ncbi:hypothetical protein C7M84_013925 [Penaeus vannamei]|uniref:Dynein heavy chain tail domain-containing protein n=1 Tax=Penaeus vannamei TaxID=6689 RepID=A0A3R7LYH9_PENVA|nr:hypothetical protein C7M84_013925 [Penaeus vannamei]
MVLQWSERVTQKIPKLLVTPVLTRDPGHEGVGGWKVQLPGELQWVVWEAGQLQQAGIRPPQLAAHLTLHYQTLQTAAMGLHLTLKDYHAVLDQLSPVQRELLRAELAGADRVLAAGQRVVTWSPAALTHFSTCCRGVVEHVRSIATRLIGITQRLEDLLDDLVNTCLLEVAFDPEHAPLHPPSLHELLEECSQRREEEVKKLKETYETLVRTLSSAGLLVAGAEDGAPESLAAHIRAAPELRVRLAPFLAHWRGNVQEAITICYCRFISFPFPMSAPHLLTSSPHSPFPIRHSIYHSSPSPPFIAICAMSATLVLSPCLLYSLCPRAFASLTASPYSPLPAPPSARPHPSPRCPSCGVTALIRRSLALGLPGLGCPTAGVRGSSSVGSATVRPSPSQPSSSCRARPLSDPWPKDTMFQAGWRGCGPEAARCRGGRPRGWAGSAAAGRGGLDGSNEPTLPGLGRSIPAL